MRLVFSSVAFFLAAAIAGTSAHAQAAAGPPVRPIGRIVASTPADFTFIAEVRGLSDGRVLVHDRSRRMVVMLDSMLRGARVVLDTAHGGANSYSGSSLPGSLFRGLGDTSLFLDPTAASFLLVDPSGAIAGTRALPADGRPTITFVGRAAADLNASMVSAPFAQGAGSPAMSERFGLVYGPPRAATLPRFPTNSGGDTVFFTVEDSAPIFAMNPRTRAVDTLARFAQATMTRYAVPPGRISGRGSVVPRLAETGDAWAVMADGSIAILRGREYRISWFNADGTRTESRPLPYAWKRLFDDEKQRMLDSAERAERQRYDADLAKGKADSAAGRPYTGIARGADNRPVPGRVTPSPALRYDLGTIPDYVSPFIPGPRRLLPDADNNVWIRIGRGDVTEASETYDVVNRRSELIDRVRLPEGHQLVGFSPGGVVFMIGHDGGKQLLKRARVR